MNENSNTLRLRRMGIDTSQESVIFMREDCHICRAEGFSALARVKVSLGEHSIIATVVKTNAKLLEMGQAGVSESAWRLLDGRENVEVTVSHPDPVDSLRHVRSKIYGHRLSEGELCAIVEDVVAGHYSDVELAAFLTACSADNLTTSEIISLTRAMTGVGEQLEWGTEPILDKHCIGGLPGNRTTPIIVAIVAACGLTIPKTSSRAITSPAGTADTMETLAPVDLSIGDMRRVVEREGGCVVWGGAVRLSPADDIFIRVERALDIDGEGQLIASVLSKKAAAGSTHLVLDIPVGDTAKVRDRLTAGRLSKLLSEVAGVMGIATKIVTTDGTQPVGRGIGPSLEALDVLSVLEYRPDRSKELENRAIALAGALLELGGLSSDGEGDILARQVLTDGRAWTKFQAICEAQGGMRTPPRAPFTRSIEAERKGVIQKIDNRNLAKIAKLAGAPEAKSAGLELHAAVGTPVDMGEPVFTVHAESPGELDYAIDFATSSRRVFEVEEPE